MPSSPAIEYDHLEFEAKYIQVNPTRRETLIDCIRKVADIGSGHHFKDQRHRFYREIAEIFESHRVSFHPDNVGASARLNQIFQRVPRGGFSQAIRPLLAWLWNTNAQAASEFYKQIGLEIPDWQGTMAPGSIIAHDAGGAEPQLLDTLHDYLDPSRSLYVDMSLHTTMDGAVALSHDVPWAVGIRRFEFFREDNALILVTSDGSRRPVAENLSDHIARRLLSVDSIRVILWERGPQPGALSHDHYPLKIIA